MVDGMRKLSCSSVFWWRFAMTHGTTALSFLDTFLLMAPMATFMILALFGMDERLSASRARIGHRPRFCEVGPDGHGLLSDPDGRCGIRTGFPPVGSRPRGKFPRGVAAASSGRCDFYPENYAIVIKVKDLK